MTAEELLAEARALITRRSSATRGLWPRAAALLGRRALEEAITEHDPRLAHVLGRARLLCLRRTLGDPALAEERRPRLGDLGPRDAPPRRRPAAHLR